MKNNSLTQLNIFISGVLFVIVVAYIMSKNQKNTTGLTIASALVIYFATNCLLSGFIGGAIVGLILSKYSLKETFSTVESDNAFLKTQYEGFSNEEEDVEEGFDEDEEEEEGFEDDDVLEGFDEDKEDKEEGFEDDDDEIEGFANQIKKSKGKKAKKATKAKKNPPPNNGERAEFLELGKKYKAPSEDDDKDFHLDAGTTFLNAYKTLKPDQVASMTKDTQDLMQTQKQLMSTLHTLKPLIKDGKEMMNMFQSYFGAGDPTTA